MPDTHGVLEGARAGPRGESRLQSRNVRGTGGEAIRSLLASLSLTLLLAVGCAGSAGDPTAYPMPAVPPAPVPTEAAAPIILIMPTGEPAPAVEPAPTREPASEPAPTEEPEAGPVSADVTTLPIWVKSTADHYFVLYARYGYDEYPVLVKPGEDGMTTLAENIPMLPPERYRVERYSILNPGDVDRDGIDDLTELRSPGSMSPVNSAAATNLEDGAVSIADAGAFKSLGTLLGGYRTVKFIVFGLEQDRPGVVFLNTGAYTHHDPFAEAVGLKDSPLYENRVRGYLIRGQARGLGEEKLFHFHLLDRDIDFDTVERIYAVLAANLPAAEGDLRMWIRNYQVGHIQTELELYQASRIPLLFNRDVYGWRSFEVLNAGTTYGLLRVMQPGDRPHPRDIVIYDTLPN